MYTTDDIITEFGREISLYVKPSTMLPMKVAGKPWLKKLICPHILDKYVLKVVFAEDILQSIRNSMKVYWSTQYNVPLEKLAYDATSLTKLQAAAPPEKQVALYTNSWHESNIRQTNSLQGRLTTSERQATRLSEDHTAEKEFK